LVGIKIYEKIISLFKGNRGAFFQNGMVVAPWANVMYLQIPFLITVAAGLRGNCSNKFSRS